jgi:hypothetical protein
MAWHGMGLDLMEWKVEGRFFVIDFLICDLMRRRRFGYHTLYVYSRLAFLRSHDFMRYLSGDEDENEEEVYIIVLFCSREVK